MATSRVIHHSIDPSIPIDVKKVEADEDEGGGEKDPDKVITNARAASLADGLLTTTELTSMFADSGLLRSTYDEGQRKYLASGNSIATCGDRLNIPLSKSGACEPEWTSYTHYWKQVLGNIIYLKIRYLVTNRSSVKIISSFWILPAALQ